MAINDATLGKQTSTNGTFVGAPGTAGTIYSFDAGGFSAYKQFMATSPGSFLFGTNDMTIQIRGTSLFPNLDGGTSLGDSTHRWNSLFVSNGVNVIGANAGALTLSDSSGSPSVRIAAGSALSVEVTNIVGLVEVSSASVIELDFNAAGKFSITNRISAATTLVQTNGSAGQQVSVFMLGEASGGTARVVTIQPQLGFLVINEDTFGSALATSFSFTLTNGNGAEINSEVRRLNGSNCLAIVTRQFAF
jgi:hypothetical protein